MMAYRVRMKNHAYSPCKPDMWGMKFYVLAESETGFVYNLRIVSEKCNIENTILELTENLAECNRTLYVDNLYNSFSLAEKLLELGIFICGTLRDRRDGPSNLKQLKLNNKGESMYFQKENTQILL